MWYQMYVDGTECHNEQIAARVSRARVRLDRPIDCLIQLNILGLLSYKARHISIEPIS
jgi:hypothetical protein